MKTLQVPNCFSVPKETPWVAGTLKGKLGLSQQAKNKLVLLHEIPQFMYIERTTRAKLPSRFTAPETSCCQKHIQLFAL